MIIGGRVVSAAKKSIKQELVTYKIINLSTVNDILLK